MSTLIVSIAGQSTRFPNTRPKALLTHPSGRMMLIEGLMGLELKKYKEVLVLVLQSQIDSYNPNIFGAFMEIGIPVKVYVLKQPTQSLAEAVYNCITDENITGSITIKDCDNYFQ